MEISRGLCIFFRSIRRTSLGRVGCPLVHVRTFSIRSSWWHRYNCLLAQNRLKSMRWGSLSFLFLHYSGLPLHFFCPLHFGVDQFTWEVHVHLEAGIEQNVYRGWVVVFPLKGDHFLVKFGYVIVPSTHIEDLVLVLVVLFEESSHLYYK